MKLDKKLLKDLNTILKHQYLLERRLDDIDNINSADTAVYDYVVDIGMALGAIYDHLGLDVDKVISKIELD